MIQNILLELCRVLNYIYTLLKLSKHQCKDKMYEMVNNSYYIIINISHYYFESIISHFKISSTYLLKSNKLKCIKNN